VQKNIVTKTQELVYELLVSEVMTKNVITIAPETPMSKLRYVLRDNRISGVPVVKGGRLIGIISVEDYIKWLCDNEPDCPIAGRMTNKTITIFEDEPLVRAINKLEQLGFGRLPVLKRSTGKIAGVLTKGDIIAGLLKKLDIDFSKSEMSIDRPEYIFDTIVADKSKLIFEYKVEGCDLNKAGSSASGLKTTLIQLGISPQYVRRAAIATYEAEMNLLFYSEGGFIMASLEPYVISLLVEDTGPGIPDIEQAMQPGFSTAPDWVRELGFGAGMGLQNIKSCTDKMHIESVPGKGTRLELEITMDENNATG
jgi:CBS domain-containing protein/anti-sigma regulatory factor (Ser/Thr protein kinase)